MKKIRLKEDCILPDVTELIRDGRSYGWKLRVTLAGPASPQCRPHMVFQKGQRDKTEVVSSDCGKGDQEEQKSVKDLLCICHGYELI